MFPLLDLDVTNHRPSMYIIADLSCFWSEGNNYLILKGEGMFFFIFCQQSWQKKLIELKDAKNRLLSFWRNFFVKYRFCMSKKIGFLFCKKTLLAGIYSNVSLHLGIKDFFLLFFQCFNIKELVKQTCIILIFLIEHEKY
jgi:hypothetical protein